MEDHLDRVPKSLLTVLNENFETETGFPYYLGRWWDRELGCWMYWFADDTTNVTYRGALMRMQHAIADLPSRD